jgi:glycosyltransferase involved in cell wall biosynthesis
MNDRNLFGINVLMLAPCLGKFGGIETFCLTLIEDLIFRGATVRLLRKKVAGFEEDGSIDRNELEIRSAWTSEQRSRFDSEFVKPRVAIIKKAIQECDILHLHNPMIEGVWYAKKWDKICVMTVYNWRRNGWHPRLWAWRWAVAQADRRWYISEFVWDSWERNRRTGSARLPVVSRMPTGEIPPEKRKGFLFIGRWVPNKGIRILLEAYRKISPNPELWPLIMIGDGPLKADVEKIIRQNKIKGVDLPGFVSEADRHRYTKEAKWMVTPPHTNEDLGLTPLEARSVGVPCIATDDGGVPETAGKHALFCKRGCVKSLANRLQEAVDMCEAEYEQKALATKEGLQDYVRPLDEYAKNYLQLLHRN